LVLRGGGVACAGVPRGVDGGVGGVVVGDGEQGADGLGGAGGDGGEDGDLVHVGLVKDLDVECLVEGGLEAFGLEVDGVGEEGRSSSRLVSSSRAGVLARAVRCSWVVSRSAWSSANRSQQRARMAWAAVLAGSRVPGA